MLRTRLLLVTCGLLALAGQSIVEAQAVVMTVETRLDGSETQVLVGGKPSGETMAIKRTDEHHTSCIVKLNGKLFGTTQTTLSADGKILTTQNDYSSSSGGNPAGKFTETWVLQ